MTPQIDCLVIGGGPAGLTAAIYLARFHMNVIVADAGGGRATLIPLSRNHAGFPEGIAGRDLVERMRVQVPLYGATVVAANITAGLGAACTSEGCLIVDEHMRTSLVGLYAAGDVVKGLDQISSAMGQGGISATAIRNDLAERALPLR